MKPPIPDKVRCLCTELQEPGRNPPCHVAARAMPRYYNWRLGACGDNSDDWLRCQTEVPVAVVWAGHKQATVLRRKIVYQVNAARGWALRLDPARPIAPSLSFRRGRPALMPP